MSPTWADIVANDMKLPRTQSNVTRNPKPTELPERSGWSPNPRGMETTKPKIQSQQQEADSTDMNQQLQDRTHSDKPVIMDEIGKDKPSPRTKAETIEDTDQPKQDTPIPGTEAQTAQIPTNTHERTTIETHGQLRNGIYHEIRSETRSQIVDEYFCSPTVQDALSHIICADAFCKHQIPVRGIKGRWATCEQCSQKTCVMSSCSLLERNHLNHGWQICPDGAAAMGLERIAKARRWRRCDACRRFLLKIEGDSRGRNLPCEDCADGERG
jgi:hypothetical protein